jgi:hypothetical protein
MRKNIIFAVVATLIAVLGVATGWKMRGQRIEKDTNMVMLARSMESASLTSGALSCLTSDQKDKAILLLRLSLGSSVTQADDLVKRGTRIPPYSVNLIKGMTQAQQYSSSNGMADTAAEAKRVLDALAASGK